MCAANSPKQAESYVFPDLIQDPEIDSDLSRVNKTGVKNFDRKRLSTDMLTSHE